MRSTLFTLLFFVVCNAIFGQNYTTTMPPAGVRTMAEWEETGTLLVAWNSYKPAITQIVKAAKKECKVLVCCNTQSDIQNAKNTIADTSSNIEFAIIPPSTVWIRDYGPTTVYQNDVDSIYLIDWIYNRANRENDDNLPVVYGAYAGIPVYSTKIPQNDMVNTGGNFMSDGMGTAFASKLVLRNNNQLMDGEGNNGNDIFGTANHTAQSIDALMDDYMGIKRYIKMKELPFDGIHHIDMHMKLLDEETILLGQYPNGVSDGPQIEANIQYVLDSFKTSFGRDFRVLRMPMPSINGGFPPYPNKALYPTYVNMLIVNKTIIMPKYNHVMDVAAQDTLKKYMPGYEIVVIDCISPANNNPINSGGAIHCISKEVGVQQPLRIVHAAIRSADVDIPAQWQVKSLVQHRSGIAGVSLFYTTNLNTGYTEIPMTASSTANYFEANIPIQPAGTTIYYYIHATANDGKTINRPMPAPEGYWTFKAVQSSSTRWEDVAKMAAIYPNPASAITVVPVNVKSTVRANVLLVNMFGQVISTIFEGEIPTGSHNYFIHADQYPAGIYQVVLQTAHQQITQKLVIAE
jgi:agmatine deiminase